MQGISKMVFSRIQFSASKNSTGLLPLKNLATLVNRHPSREIRYLAEVFVSVVRSPVYRCRLPFC